jgi:hypothetical protein
LVPDLPRRLRDAASPRLIAADRVCDRPGIPRPVSFVAHHRPPARIGDVKNRSRLLIPIAASAPRSPASRGLHFCPSCSLAEPPSRWPLRRSLLSRPSRRRRPPQEKWRRPQAGRLTRSGPHNEQPRLHDDAPIRALRSEFRKIARRHDRDERMAIPGGCRSRSGTRRAGPDRRRTRRGSGRVLGPTPNCEGTVRP